MKKKFKSTSKNPFRYISFTEQIASLSADVTRWQIALPTTTTERETFFYDAVLKWNDSDYGAYYISFLNDVPFENGELRTYAQLLHHQKTIFNALLKHLSIEHSTSLVTILELTIAFARDLREDLSDYLWDLFEAIIVLMERSDQQAELLQTGFRALAVMIKLQWRKIIRELRRTFVRFERLFSSRRGYLRRFAAEAFAFLLRKSNSVGKLTIFLAERAEKENSDSLTDGISQLYFNAVKGVMNRFHSSAPQILSEILDSILQIPEDSSTRQMAIKIIEGMMRRCASYAKKEHTSPIFDVLLNRFQSIVRSVPAVGHYLDAIAIAKLLLVWVKTKKGTAVADTSGLMKAIRESASEMNDHIIDRDWLELVSATMLTYGAEPGIGQMSTVLNKIAEKTESEHVDLVLELFYELSSASSFDIWVMPVFGRFAQKIIEEKNDAELPKIFKFYAILCAKRKPLTKTIGDRKSFFDVFTHVEVRKKMTECILNYRETNCCVEMATTVTCAIRAYPWLWREAERPQHKKEGECCVDYTDSEALICILRSSMQNSSSQTFSSHLSLITAHTISLIDTKLFSDFTVDELLDFVRRENCSENALRTLHIILPNTNQLKSNDQSDALIKISQEILPCLGHWDSRVRQIALEVLNSFDVPLIGTHSANGDDELESAPQSAFEILLEVERTPLTLTDYRNRLMLLRKLLFGAHEKHMPKCTNDALETVPLRVIIAQLFERFTIYWPPLFEIIESYAYGMKLNQFWPIFVAFIEDATKHLVSSAVEDERCTRTDSTARIFDQLCDVSSSRSPDYGMFRLQMFNLLSKLDEIAEKTTKTLSPWLLALYTQEYESVDFMSRNRQNITWTNPSACELNAIELDGENDEEDGDEEMEVEQSNENENDTEDVVNETNNVDDEEENCSKSAKNLEETCGKGKRKQSANEDEDGKRSNFVIDRKMIKRTIVALLETFSKFRTPKTIYMEREIRQLYDQLLLVPDEAIQKAVLKCLLAYKYKFLTPYKENFENVVSDRTFLNELIRFGLDAQDSAVADEHRASVIPILMRLLYGKMQTHVTKDAFARRAAIFRFLAGCRAEELDVFMQILFAPLLEFVDQGGFNKSAEQKSLGELCSTVCESFDATSMVPLAKIKGCLNSLSHVINKLSPSLADYQQTSLYRVCLMAALLIRLAVGIDLNKIHPKNIRLLKELRGLICLRFKELFFAFQHRAFTSTEINVLFEYFVTPLCNTLSRNTSAIAPVAVLRLFESWTEIPKLFFLLQYRMNLTNANDSEAVTPLSVMCNCLLSKCTNTSSKERITKSVLNLLTLADEENNAIPTELTLVDVKRPSNVNFGTALVLSQLPKLLTFISESLPSANERKRINLKHLEILSRIGEFVDDASISERLATTLLSYVRLGGAAVRSEETLNSLLTTVSRLIPTVQKPLNFLPFLIQQHSTIKSRSSRDALCEIVSALASCQQAGGRVAQLLCYVLDLNSWDERKVDEPDHERRHIAYNQLSQIWDSGEVINVSILQMIVHNHYFTITETKDLSLRCAASTNLRGLIEYAGVCAMNDQDRESTLERHLLPLVLKGVHSEIETIRHEFISSLVSLIIAFPTHKQLRHLVQLRNVDEIDLDFFVNIAHIQVHRRQRALYRLTDSLQSEQTKIPVEVLLRFILPLIQPYAVDFTSKTSALSDEAIRLLSYIMSVAPWKRYYPMIDFYLKRLQRDNINQKANIRIIVAIIDAFHFDVTSDDDDESDWKSIRKVKKPCEKLESRELSATNGEDSADENAEVMDVDGESTTADKDNDLESTGQKGDEPVQGAGTGSSAVSIRHKVMGVLLPRLKDCATGKDLHSHRKAQVGKHYTDDDHIQRAPIALATVKLLKKMPQTIIDQHLHGVVLKLCTLLMSRSINVREVARKTIISVVEALGPKYLPFVVKEMKMILNKGYQVHVMIFTTHALISAMEAHLSPKDLDACLSEIMQVCSMDLFGDTADEKEISGITKDVPEAKANRTFDTYTLLGRFVGSQSMGIVLKPLREVIESRPMAKTIKQVGQLLRHFAIGLCANEGITPETMLIFAHQTLSTHIDEVVSATKSIKNSGECNEVESGPRREKSCLLLEKEPTRIGVIVKTSVKSRMFVFVEFGLQLLAAVLKSKKFDADNDGHMAQIDPFVSIVSDCLQLKYDKVISNGLRCFISLLNYPLPSLKNHVQTFVDRLFILLADYAAMGEAGSKGAVLELSQLLFKAFTQMIKDAPTLVLSPKRLQLLLNYVETDVVDGQKQATAFPLIKAIISRKLQDSKLVDLTNYLCELAITSQLAHIRAQCRQVLLQYIGNHPQSKKPKYYVDFFIAQLEYEYEDGRVSAIEMLNSLFDSFTQNVNDQHCLLALVNLGARLTNDKSLKCRRMITLATRKLFESVSESRLNDVYLAMRDWLEAKKEQSRSIAMQMLVEMAEVRNEIVSNKLNELLPYVTQTIQPNILSEYTEMNITKIIDSLTALIRKCESAAKQAANSGLFDEILKHLEDFAKCLESPAIQLASARLLGQLFAALELNFFHPKECPSVKELIDWTCWQLKNRSLGDDLAEQAAKNIVFLSAALSTDEDLQWLCKKLSSVCKFEIAHQPGESLKRLSVFKLAAALILRVDVAQQLIIVDAFLPSLHREMMGKSSQSQNSEQLEEVSMEVAEIFKERIGEKNYTQKLSGCQKMCAEKSEQRKRREKEEAIVDPASAALKKQKKNKAKAKARKRKLDVDKPYRTAIRKKKRESQQ